jgi:hypothetical protein
METLTFTTKHGIIQATPLEIDKAFGEYNQAWGVVLIRESGIKKLRQYFIPVNQTFTQKLAEEIAWFQTPEGIKVNRQQLEQFVKYLRDLE